MTRLVQRGLAALVVVAAIVVEPALAAPAHAAWSASATGVHRSVAVTMPTGPTPTVTSVPETVVVVVVSRRYTVTWAASTVGAPGDATRATRYVVSRVSPSTSTLCSVDVAATNAGPYSCQEVLVLSDLSGPPTYRITPQYENWIGPQGPPAS